MATKTKTSAAARDKAIAAKQALMDQLEAFKNGDHDAWILAQLTHFEAKYSPRNAMLIVMQAPEAIEVAGFKAWQERGRQVRKGEHGIRILAPAGRAAGTEPTEADPEGKPGRQFFRLTAVFDITQTEPIEPAKEAEPIDWEYEFKDNPEDL
jgi:hypothetical protein